MSAPLICLPCLPNIFCKVEVLLLKTSDEPQLSQETPPAPSRQAPLIKPFPCRYKVTKAGGPYRGQESLRKELVQQAFQQVCFPHLSLPFPTSLSRPRGHIAPPWVLTLVPGLVLAAFHLFPLAVRVPFSLLLLLYPRNPLPPSLCLYLNRSSHFFPLCPCARRVLRRSVSSPCAVREAPAHAPGGPVRGRTSRYTLHPSVLNWAQMESVTCVPGSHSHHDVSGPSLICLDTPKLDPSLPSFPQSLLISRSVF